MLSFDAGMIYRIPALLIALTVHEYAHAAAADSLGDPTPRYMGRLTMNPLAHLDLIGTLLLLTAGFGWGKAVEVNTRYFANPKKAMTTVAFAGPGSNFMLAFMATVALGVLSGLGIFSAGVYTFLRWVQLYNVWLALFNLIPLPPLDGSKVLMGFLPGRYVFQYMQLSAYSNIILLVIVISGVSGLILRPLASVFLNSMDYFVNVFVRLVF